MERLSLSELALLYLPFSTHKTSTKGKMANSNRDTELEMSVLSAKCKYFGKNAKEHQSDGAQAHSEILRPVRNERIFRREDWQILNSSGNVSVYPFLIYES